MRILVAIAGVTLFAVFALAVSGARIRNPAAAAPTPVPFFTAIPRTESAPPATVADERIRPDGGLAGRFITPVEGIEPPTALELMPYADRPYRAGMHEGIDFPAPPGTPVRAAADGIVIRVDTSYTEWTREEQDRAIAEAFALGFTPQQTLDRLRGRQVWIDHGRGIVTRYAHLSAVAPLVLGDRITAGTLIGQVGSSGYEQGGPHLHLEVRIGDHYFGEGLPDTVLIPAVARLFRPG